MQPPNTRTSTIPLSQRTKVTLACEICRKRRVKCSGTVPCSFCVGNNHACVYDSRHRGRRGPRPRQSAEQQRVIRELAPALPQDNTSDPALSSAVLEARVPTPPSCAPARLPGQRRRNHATVSSANMLPTLPQESYGGENNLRPSNLDGHEHAREESDLNPVDGEDLECTEGIPDLDTLSHYLQLLFEKDASHTLSGHHAMSLELICHLMDLFFVHTSAYLGQIVSLPYILGALTAGRDIRWLIVAMCATTIRFSVHSSTKLLEEEPVLVDECLESLAARESLSMGVDPVIQRQLDHIKTICVLIEYQASKSLGRAAWAHIALGKALIQLGRTERGLTERESQELNEADFFLSFTENLHCLGYDRLLSPTLLQVPLESTRPQSDNKQVILQLVRLLGRAQRLCSRSLLDLQSPPWSAESELSILQAELEEHILRHPGLPCPINAGPAPTSDTGDLEAYVHLLLCHCCSIMLNKPFLPIPNQPATTGDTVEPPLQSLNFPGGPHLFLMQMERRCEASAGAICHATQSIIGLGGFYRYLTIIGYSCMQSALVLIWQLHQTPRSPSKKTLARLKCAFLVVAAVGKFHEPAKAWLDTLFYVHDTKTTLNVQTEDTHRHFRSYFARFRNADEPKFLPMDPAHAHTDKHGKADAPERENGPTVASTATTTQPVDTFSENPASWVEEYSGHLSEEVQSNGGSDDGGDQTATAKARETLGVNIEHHTPQKEPPREFANDQTPSQPIRNNEYTSISTIFAAPMMGREADETTDMMMLDWVVNSKGDGDGESEALDFSAFLCPESQFTDMIAGMDLDMEPYFDTGPAQGFPTSWF